LLLPDRLTESVWWARLPTNIGLLMPLSRA
jgi:hypothetical protein